MEYLQKDWDKQYRATSIGLAAEVTKVRLSDASRLRLAHFIEAHRNSFSCPQRFGTTTVTLTPGEKLITRAILWREIHENTGARPQDIARDMQVPVASLERPLAFLTKLGVISLERGGGDAYRAASRYPRPPSPRIDLYSHRVEVNGSDKFEVA